MSVIDAAPASSPTACRNRGNTTGCFNPWDVLIRVSFPSSPAVLKRTSWETQDWGIRMVDNYLMGCTSLGHRVRSWEASPRAGHNASAMGTLLRAQEPLQIPPRWWQRFGRVARGQSTSIRAHESILIHIQIWKMIAGRKRHKYPIFLSIWKEDNSTLSCPYLS